jgi:hypothetical protein
MKKLTVKVPAIKYGDGKIARAPNKDWHHDQIAEREGKPKKDGKRGFILSDGTFADRQVAAKVAKAAGEVKHPGKKLHSTELMKGKGN